MPYLPLIVSVAITYFVPAAAPLMILALLPILMMKHPLGGFDWAPQYPPLPPRKR